MLFFFYFFIDISRYVRLFFEFTFIIIFPQCFCFCFQCFWIELAIIATTVRRAFQPQGFTIYNIASKLLIYFFQKYVNVQKYTFEVMLVFFKFPFFYNFKYVFFSIFTLYPAYINIDRGNVLLRHFVPYFPPNFRDIAC